MYNVILALFYREPKYPLLRDRPAFPFYTTSTPEAAYTQWPLCQIRLPDLQPIDIIPYEILQKRSEGKEGGNYRGMGTGPIGFVEVGLVNIRGLHPLLEDIIAFFGSLVPPSRDEVILELSLIHRFRDIEFNRSIRALETMISDWKQLMRMRMHRLGYFGSCVMPVGPVPYEDDINRALRRRDALLPSVFTSPVEPPLEEYIHGILMPFYYEHFSLKHDEYLQLRFQWEREDQLPCDSLMRWLKKHWPPHAFSYESLDKPEETISLFTILSSFREEHIFQNVCSLPYPSRALMFVLKHHVDPGSLTDHLPFLVRTCEWMQRKLKQMANIPLSSYMFEEETKGDDECP